VASPADDEKDLTALRARIEALESELEGAEADRREARDALRASETAISEANRALAALEARAGAARRGASDFENRRRALEAELAEREAALGRLLAARAVSGAERGAPELVRLALSGEHPNELARRLHYLGILAHALARVLRDYRATLAELAALRDESAKRATEIALIEANIRADREKIHAERRDRRRVLERIGADIRRQRKEMATLVADERRLARVVETIARTLADRPGAGYRRRAERAPEAGPARGPFSSLRGKLRPPVAGELAARFATPGQGARRAKGLFIRAREGEPVRAVAAGRVVYADWMRGLGNLLIVDHGEAYLSIYGNNESLLKSAGEAVAAGERIATVGASGGNEETGLYFEMRHFGKPFDPLRWVKLK
jgi:septal ring factor EnvC (AmiA/AmiB activator)